MTNPKGASPSITDRVFPRHVLINSVKYSSSHADYNAAVKTAFEYASEIIELGREVSGLLVKDAKLVGLPLEEYLLDPHENPIRSYADKLKSTDDGNLSFAAKDNKKSWIVYFRKWLKNAIRL